MACPIVALPNKLRLPLVRQLQNLQTLSKEKTVVLAVAPAGWPQTVADLHPIGDPETSVSSGRCEMTPDFNYFHKGHIQEADAVSTKALLKQVLSHKHVSSTASLPLDTAGPSSQLAWKSISPSDTNNNQDLTTIRLYTQSTKFTKSVHLR